MKKHERKRSESLLREIRRNIYLTYNAEDLTNKDFESFGYEPSDDDLFYLSVSDNESAAAIDNKESWERLTGKTLPLEKMVDIYQYAYKYKGTCGTAI